MTLKFMKAYLLVASLILSISSASSKELKSVTEGEYLCKGDAKSYQFKRKTFKDNSYKQEAILTYRDNTKRISIDQGKDVTRRALAFSLGEDTKITSSSNKDNPFEGRVQNRVIQGSVKKFENAQKGTHFDGKFERIKLNSKTNKEKIVTYKYDLRALEEVKAYNKALGEEIPALTILINRREAVKPGSKKLKKEDTCETSGTYSKKYGFLKWQMTDFVDDQVVWHEVCRLVNWKETPAQAS